jgi:hypothetical protein
MKELKYISILAVCGTVLILFTQIQDCNAQQTFTERHVAESHDSDFVSNIEQKYQPPSTPFSNKKSGFKLPAGVKETDVARVVSIALTPARPHPNPLLRGEGNTIDVITTKDGQTFVGKDSNLIKSVTVTDFEPPIARTVLKFGIGASVGLRDDKFSLSPSVVFAPQEWYGWIHVPVLTADLYGAGVGGQFKFYHDFYLGAVYHYSWSAEKSVRATVHFVF